MQAHRMRGGLVNLSTEVGARRLLTRMACAVALLTAIVLALAIPPAAGAYIYWTTDRSQQIGRATLDGSLAKRDWLRTTSLVPANEGNLALTGSFLYWRSILGIARTDLERSVTEDPFVRRLTPKFSVAPGFTTLAVTDEALFAVVPPEYHRKRGSITARVPPSRGEDWSAYRWRLDAPQQRSTIGQSIDRGPTPEWLVANSQWLFLASRNEVFRVSPDGFTNLDFFKPPYLQGDDIHGLALGDGYVFWEDGNKIMRTPANAAMTRRRCAAGKRCNPPSQEVLTLNGLTGGLAYDRGDLYFGTRDGWIGRATANGSNPRAHLVATGGTPVSIATNDDGPSRSAIFEPLAGLSFAAQRVGTVSAVTRILIRNNGIEPVTITRIRVLGADADDFLLGRDECGRLTPEQTCGVNVRFSPSTVGTQTGKLEATYDTTVGPKTTEAALSGTGREVDRR